MVEWHHRSRGARTGPIGRAVAAAAGATTTDSTSFDAATRTLGTALSRRRALHGVLAGAVAVIGGALALDGADARRGRKPKQRCLRAGARCTSDTQCCPDRAGLICDVPTGGSNGDTSCCGGQGAACGGADDDGDAVGPRCCANFRCSTGDPDDPNFEPFRHGTCLGGDDEF